MHYIPGSTRTLEGVARGSRARVSEALERAVRLAHSAARRPYRTTLFLFAVNLVAIGAFVAVGQAVFADRAELFRELMPGTLLSVAQLGFIAVIAWAIHRQEFPGSRLRLNNLWGISVVVFSAFVVDEATQLTIYLADLLQGLGALAPAGFKDLDAFLLTILLLAGAAALLRYGLTLLRYPAALLLFAVGGALGVGSEFLDATLASTSGEFVAEESLKLCAEPFLIGGYLLVLNAVLRRGTGASADHRV